MVNFMDFYDGVNASTAWQAAFKAALESDRTVFFPEGTYDFYPEGCTEKLHFFSNNDEAVRTIAIYLENIDDFTICGDNARFIFHGRISPLLAYNCRNLKISGFSVDFSLSFITDADLIRRENGKAYFRLAGNPPLENGKIRFVGDFYDNFSGELVFFPFDNDLQEIPCDVPALSVKNCDLTAENGLIVFPDVFSDIKQESFIIHHEIRICPAVVLDGCDHVDIENVTIHHCAGMGLLCQNSGNITVEKLRVVPNDRRTSASADALHMVDCRGKLVIRNCELCNTLDDCINVHGIYRPLKNRFTGDDFLYLDTGHFQQLGLIGARSGDTIELVKNDTAKPYCRIKVREAVMLNKAMTRVFFDGELPAEYRSGDTARIVEVSEAELIVENCILRPLNGRGVLASGVKSAVIRNNRIHTSGAGVFISGGVAYWYETGPVENLKIENNIFDNCNYKNTASTREPLSIFPELSVMPDDFYYHGRIEVLNNHFIAAPRTLISMRSVREVVCRNNSAEESNIYKFDYKVKRAYFFTDENSPVAAFDHCGKVDCDMV